MDEETAIIDSKTRNEKIKNFFINNKKTLISILLSIIIVLLGYFAFAEYTEKKRLKISDQYNSVISKFSENNKETTKNSLIEIINKNDPTYSPLSLYFIIDNKLIQDISKINVLFDIIIQDTSLSKEIRNLIIYKKALYNADNADENELLEILKPVINSKSIWKSHALYLMAEYFYSKNQKQKSKEFFNQIILLENANQDLKIESQKRLNRDLSE
ncbi:tetratricopeptide repeat protein [Candidatus Pelagibacter communis]|uniref:tetratricopeptide repeat protein n=1 Tax=Pelagibacter ubique TaxID=198252 RepID=UPI00094D9195|nr:tetratricopeptide repeat protein [Candidatus Pelagibacter ubique]